MNDIPTPEEKAQHIATIWARNVSEDIADADLEQLQYFVATALREAADVARAEERAGAEILDEEGMDANDKLSKLAGLVLDCRMGTPQGNLAKDYARFCLRRTSKDPLTDRRARTEGGDSDE